MSKEKTTTNSMIKNVREAEQKGIVPRCHFCLQDNCYILVSTKDQGMVKQYLIHGDKFVCEECHQWMIDAGTWFTKVIVFIRKITMKNKRRHYAQYAADSQTNNDK